MENVHLLTKHCSVQRCYFPKEYSKYLQKENQDGILRRGTRNNNLEAFQPGPSVLCLTSS